MAQLDLTTETAFARIQEHAFSTGTTMAHIAEAVVTHQIQLPDEHHTP